MRRPPITGNTVFNLPKDTKNIELLNGEKKTVLAHFWTSSCASCGRTIPYLREWWNKYKERNFLLVGIHTPEFEFEKESKNVERAVHKLGISWPVVLDNEYHNWNAFKNHYWPALYLADSDGTIVYTHFGEGSYQKTEFEIQQLLKHNSQSPLPPITPQKHSHGRVCITPTPKIYFGYARGITLNSHGYAQDLEFEYIVPKELPIHSSSLKGRFYADANYVESREKNAAIILHCITSEINCVLGPGGKKPAIVEIQYNNSPLSANSAGRNVNDKSEVIITEPTSYSIFRAGRAFQGIISIIAKEDNFRAYSSTFYGCGEANHGVDK